MLEFYHAMGRYEALKAGFAEWGVWIIIIKGMTPIPYKLVTIASGVAHFPLLPFIGASIVSRSLRFFLLAAAPVVVRRRRARIHRAAPDAGHERCSRWRSLAAWSRCAIYSMMILTPRAFAGFVLVASAAVLGAALLSQYWGGLAPCELCLLQRWPWAAAIAISLVALVAGSRPALPWVALVLALRVRARRRLCVLPCRGRAALVCRPDRLHRERQRRDDARGDEAPDPRHRAGAVRPGAMVAVRGVAGRLEPLGLARHGGDLRRGFPAHPPAGIAGGAAA